MASMDEEIRAMITRLVMAGDGAVLGVGVAALAVRTWFKFNWHCKALKQVTETPEVAIHDLRSIINEDNNNNSLVIVRGKVATENATEEPLAAQNTGESAVFIERTQTCLYNEWRGVFGWGEWRGLLGWGSLKEQIAISRRKIPFVLLENGARFDSSCVRIHLEELQHPLPLVTVHHQLNPVQSSSTTFLQAVFGRRYPVGIIDEEKILPLGREITAVGNLIKTSQGMPAIKPCNFLPVFLTDLNRDDLIVDIVNNTKILCWAGIILTWVAAGVLGYAFVKNWVKYKEWRRLRRRLDEVRRDILEEEPQEDVTDVPDGELCVVCLLRRRRAAFVSCGHRVCCMRCAQRVETSNNSRCPVCRQSVSGFIRIYDA